MTTDEKKLTPLAQQLVPALREQNRIERRSRPLTAIIVAAIVVAFGGIVYLLAHAEATDEVTGQLQSQGQARDQQILGIQDQLKGVCRQVTDPNKLTPAEREGCYRAERDIPPASVTVTQPASPGQESGPSAAQVQTMIDNALSTVPRPLTVEQVAATAQQVFATNAPAIAATPERLADAVSGFCAQDACRGQQGAKGESAPAVTDEQLRAQVNAYCAANSGCVGPPGVAGATGAAGPQGVSVQAFGDPESDPDQAGRCRIPVTLVDPDPATGVHTFVRYFNVPAAFCLPG